MEIKRSGQFPIGENFVVLEFADGEWFVHVFQEEKETIEFLQQDDRSEYVILRAVKMIVDKRIVEEQ